VNRRSLITLLGGAAAWPLAARAQQPERVRRVGVLVNSVETGLAIQGRIAAFRQALERLGWFEGRNTDIELRFSANNYEQVPQLAQEIVAILTPREAAAAITMTLDGRTQPRTEPAGLKRRSRSAWATPVSLRTNARAKSSMRLRTTDRDAARRPWQVR